MLLISGGMASFPVMTNCLVHIIMYTYYFTTAMGPKWQKGVAKYKKYLTIIQMVSFNFVKDEGTNLNYHLRDL